MRWAFIALSFPRVEEFLQQEETQNFGTTLAVCEWYLFPLKQLEKNALKKVECIGGHMLSRFANFRFLKNVPISKYQLLITDFKIRLFQPLKHKFP